MAIKNKQHFHHQLIKAHWIWLLLLRIKTITEQKCKQIKKIMKINCRKMQIWNCKSNKAANRIIKRQNQYQDQLKVLRIWNIKEGRLHILHSGHLIRWINMAALADLERAFKAIKIAQLRGATNYRRGEAIRRSPNWACLNKIIQILKI